MTQPPAPPPAAPLPPYYGCSRMWGLCCSASRATRRNVRASRIVANVSTRSIPLVVGEHEVLVAKRRMPRRGVRHSPGRITDRGRASATAVSSAARPPELVTLGRRCAPCRAIRLCPAPHRAARAAARRPPPRPRPACSWRSSPYMSPAAPRARGGRHPRGEPARARVRACGGRERRSQIRDRLSLAGSVPGRRARVAHASCSMLSRSLPRFLRRGLCLRRPEGAERDELLPRPGSRSW